ncbi:MAG: hypothetical protein I8H94_01950 [Rhodobacteraceae bacterium]|nr:hypothetical protein [Paracoccaceae bacterium]
MRRIGLAALIGVCGVAVMFAAMVQDGGLPRYFRLGPFLGEFLLPTFFSGLAAGLLLAPVFERANLILTGCCALLATLFGAMLGGFYVGATEAGLHAAEGAMSAAVLIWQMLWQSPTAMVVWLGCFAVVHLVMRRYSLK